jgi:hypothetical protein
MIDQKIKDVKIDQEIMYLSQILLEIMYNIIYHYPWNIKFPTITDMVSDNIGFIFEMFFP